jgi:cysteine synthase
VMVLSIIRAAEEQGLLRPGMRIIEQTSGNAGIAYAMVSALRGYRFTAVMVENAPKERRQMMQSFGAEIVLTPAEAWHQGALDRLEELGKDDKDAWLPRQYENPANQAGHRDITGRSILEQVGEDIDIFVAGVGTGGTLVGVAQALKRVNPAVKVVAVEPEESAAMSGKGTPRVHQIWGLGAGFITPLLKTHMSLVDEIITVRTDEAVEMSRRLMREEGLMVGISSGANVCAALEVARRARKNATVVTILPDRGERYLSVLDSSRDARPA